VGSRTGGPWWPGPAGFCQAAGSYSLRSPPRAFHALDPCINRLGNRRLSGGWTAQSTRHASTCPPADLRQESAVDQSPRRADQRVLRPQPETVDQTPWPSSGTRQARRIHAANECSGRELRRRATALDLGRQQATASAMTTNHALATTTLPHPDVADGSPPQPVGAENRVTGLTSILPRASPQGHVPNQPSMIARRGPRTCLPDARSRAELAGATRPLRHRQGRRDPHAATRKSRCCAAPTHDQPSPGSTAPHSAH
jgi:hypothetical protein